MTILKKERATSAGKFVDEILKDILSAPEKDILEDDDELTTATGEPADRFVDRVVAASKAEIGKRRFANAKADLQEKNKRSTITVVPRDAAGVVRGYVDSLKTAASKLSLAARGARQLSKHDLDTAIEDLAELEARKRRPKKK
jgi:hypothetical protein